jgi:hypothetical protein
MTYVWSLDARGRVQRRRFDEAHPPTIEQRRQRIAARLAQLDTPSPVTKTTATSSPAGSPPSGHRLPPSVLDKTLPLAERQRAYAQWAGGRQPHTHPGTGWHTHPAGNRPHEHGPK